MQLLADLVAEVAVALQHRLEQLEPALGAQAQVEQEEVGPERGPFGQRLRSCCAAASMQGDTATALPRRGASHAGCGRCRTARRRDAPPLAPDAVP